MSRQIIWGSPPDIYWVGSFGFKVKSVGGQGMGKEPNFWELEEIDKVDMRGGCCSAALLMFIGVPAAVIYGVVRVIQMLI